MKKNTIKVLVDVTNKRMVFGNVEEEAELLIKENAEFYIYEIEHFHNVPELVGFALRDEFKSGSRLGRSC
jgi:hypothetical protein